MHPAYLYPLTDGTKGMQIPYTLLRRCFPKGDPNEAIVSVKGERFRAYRRLYDAGSGGERRLNFPVDMSMEIVDYCNYSCPYCLRSVERGSGNIMTMETFCRIIDGFVEANGGLGGISLAYGESLIDKKLEEKIEYAIAKGVQDVLLGTNGVYLTPERSERLIKAGLTKIGISLDAATQETYTKCRGGDLASVEENVRKLVEIRDRLESLTPIVRISFVMSELNEHEADDFENKWKDIADFIDFQRMIDHSRRDSLPDFEVTEPIDCFYPSYHIAVNSRGDFKPCCSEYGDFLIVARSGEGATVGSAFDSEKMRYLRRSFSEHKDYDRACKNCRGKLPEGIASSPLLTPAAGKPLGKVPTS